MAGIYIHIPFCRKACTYCDFHFSTNLSNKTALLEALSHELEQRSGYLQGREVQTIYFGGGTPSLLDTSELKKLLETINQRYPVAATAEITLEANPDDLTAGKAAQLQAAGINRISIGIQSFSDAHLRWMNRAHTAEQAISSVKDAQAAGISNITIDLIYGIPGMTRQEWMENLQTAISLGIPHISAYCLTVEERTPLEKLVREKKVQESSDEEIEWQVDTMDELLADAGFRRYEISNFALPGRESRHNSAYWSGEWYLGAGPSAHSYNGTSREWNISSNAAYIEGLRSGKKVSETEYIDETTAYNEYVMTRLRTWQGLDLSELRQKFMIDLLADFPDETTDLLAEGEAIVEDNHFRLTHEGRFFADAIAASLFLDKDDR